MITRNEPSTVASDVAPDAAASSAVEAASRQARAVLVWDLPIRLFHWLTVVLIPAAYLTWRLNWMDWHAWIGDALLALLLFRLLWGFFGSDTARFSQFLASPARSMRHLAHIFRGEPDLSAGHNPAGSWMVVLLLALLLGQVFTGVFVDNDVANEGPFTELTPAPISNLMTALHDRFLWHALLAAAALHIIAILVYAVAKRHNLVLPMITGRKTLPYRVRPPRLGSPARALVLLACAAAAAAALAKYL